MRRNKVDYVELHVRVPPGLYKRIEEYAGRWGLSLQDAVVFLLLSLFEEVEEVG